MSSGTPSPSDMPRGTFNVSTAVPQVQCNLNELVGVSPWQLYSDVMRGARSPNGSLAYVLGAWAASSTFQTSQAFHLDFCSRDQSTLSSVAVHLTSYLGCDVEPLPTFINSKPCYRIRVGGRQLSAHVHDVTAGNTRVPWEHLGTPDEYRNYLRGIFDQAGGIAVGAQAGIGFTRLNGYPLLIDIARVFMLLRMAPLVDAGPMASLRLLDRNDWETFRVEVGYSVPTLQDKLQKLCGKSFKCAAYSVDHYKHVMTYVKDPSPDYQRIAEESGVSVGSVKDWLNRGKTPRSLQRIVKLESATRGMANGPLINQLYRQAGYSSQAARALALE